MIKKLCLAVSVVALMACSQASNPDAATTVEDVPGDNVVAVNIYDPDAFFDNASDDVKAILAEIRDIDVSIAQTDPDAIVNAVNDARDKADGLLPDNHPAWAALTNLEATAAFYAGDPAAAYQGLKDSLQQFKQAGHHPSDETIETLGSLVTIARMRGENEQSEAYLEEQRVSVEAIQGQSSMDMSQILYNKGAIAFSRSDYDIAIDFMTQAVDMSWREYDPDKSEEVERVVGQTTSLAALYDRTNSPALAAEYNRRASDLAASGLPIGQPTRLFAQNNYAAMLSNQGRYAEARPILVDVVNQQRQGPDPESREVGIALHSLGFSLLKLGDLDRSEENFQQARRLLLQGEGRGEPLRASLALTMLAEIADLSGDYALARDRWIEADAEFQTQTDADNAERMPVLLSLSRNAIKRGDEAAIDEPAEEALRIVETRGMLNHPFGLQARILTRLDEAEARQAMIAEAVAISARETAAARLSPDYNPGRLSIYHPVLDVAAGLALRDGNFDIALSALQLRHLDEVAESAIAARLRQNNSDDNGLKDLQDAQRQYADSDQDYMAAMTSGGETLAELSADRNAKLERVRSLISQTEPEALDWNAADMDRIRQRLLDGQGLLVVHLSDLFPTVALITDDEALISPIEATHVALSDAIRAFRQEVEPGSTTGATFNASQTIHDLLLPDALRTVVNNLDDLLIYAPGDGASIPFSALQNEDGIWLGETVGLRILPTLSSLGAASDVPANATFLGIGDPALAPLTSTPTYIAALELAGPQTLMRGGVGDVEAIRSLASLPATRKELESVARFFGPDQSRILLGRDATEVNIREVDLSGYDVISFATHALVSNEIPGLREPALVLTPPENQPESETNDGLLTRSEIAAFQMDGGWIVLSACNTASSRNLGAPGLSGLTSAFLYGGADTLMVSHWPVRDDTAAFLSTRTITAAAEGLSPEQALRQAMADLRASDLPDAKHPSAWAPFFIVGG